MSSKEIIQAYTNKIKSKLRAGVDLPKPLLGSYSVPPKKEKEA